MWDSLYSYAGLLASQVETHIVSPSLVMLSGSGIDADHPLWWSECVLRIRSERTPRRAKSSSVGAAESPASAGHWPPPLSPTAMLSAVHKHTHKAHPLNNAISDVHLRYLFFLHAGCLLSWHLKRSYLIGTKTVAYARNQVMQIRDGRVCNYSTLTDSAWACRMKTPMHCW